MEKIIASYLVQKKECSLPGIGHFKITTKPAQLDIANKKLFPPTDEIIFKEDEVHLRKDLVSYVSLQKKIHENDAAEDINNWCQHSKNKMDLGGKICFESIGSLQKNAAGNIFFNKKNEFLLNDTVPAERVIHKNEQHSVLVGDKQTTSAVMNEFYKEDVIVDKKPWWKIWAVILFSLPLLILIIHFSGHSFTTSGVGNQIHLSPEAPPVLYETK